MRETAQKRIVLVEREAQLAAALAQAVVGDGYCCDTVTTAAEMTTVVCNSRPDLVLIDGHPDGLDPRVLCQSIRHGGDNANVKIVVLNNTGRSIERRRCRAFGADGMLAKPFGLDELRAELHRLLDVAPVDVV